MRVHRLEITAFGPFAATEVIDFDALSDAGVFLLTGPTGAGKTTVLDAICFGLYGSVPGDRNGAKDLKSHHAPADAEPTVVLELSVRGRRLRTRRSPSWSRPSRRARSGFVEEHAKATVEESVEGRWVPLAARVDDVSLLVSRALGMSRDQFCQVVMLPQGMFQTFLRAGAKERHDVLQSLFETGRFSRVEGWLTEHRRACDRAVEQQHATLCRLLARAQEVGGDAGRDIGSALDLGDLPQARRAVVALVDDTAAAAFRAHQEEAATRVRSKATRHALDDARDLDARQRSHRAGRERLRELEAVRGVVADRATRLARAEQARSFAPLLDLLAAAEKAVDEAEARVRAAAQRAGVGCLAPTPGDAEATVSARRSRLAELEAMLPVENTALQLSERAADIEAELSGLESRRDQLVTVAGELPDLLADARARQLTRHDLAATLPALRKALSAARSASAAAVEHARLSDELTDLETACASAADNRLAARSTWLDLREERLRGMAAELAGQLSDGAPCLVCGSSSHPEPATGTGRQVSPDVEATALEDLQACEEKHSRLVERVVALQAVVARAVAISGGMSADEAQAEVVTLEAQVTAAAEASAALEVLAVQIDALEAERRDAARDLNELDTACALRRQSLHTVRAQLGEAVTALSRVVGPEVSLGGAVRAARAELGVAAELASELHELGRCRASYSDTSGRLLEALSAGDFDDLTDLRGAAMSEADAAAADALNRAYDAEVRDAVRIVEDPVLTSAASVPAPDLATLEASVEQAEARQASARATADRLADRSERLEALLDEVDEGLASWLPLVERRDLAASVAAMCAGTAADNPTKTRLSHYVLATRLAQVTDAANLRLASVAGGRYQIEHSMQRGVGDTRGGLGLLVLDSYTGHRRDPATLSGGETFYVSLALALGLADLVRDEIGGAELSTLFVDEGFGSLDTQTLDEVMDEIDSLRSGGRCVGIVSHLGELRTRIPVQLQVHAGRRGSTVSRTG